MRGIAAQQRRWAARRLAGEHPSRRVGILTNSLFTKSLSSCIEAEGSARAGGRRAPARWLAGHQAERPAGHVPSCTGSTVHGGASRPQAAQCGPAPQGRSAAQGSAAAAPSRRSRGGQTGHRKWRGTWPPCPPGRKEGTQPPSRKPGPPLPTCGPGDGTAELRAHSLGQGRRPGRALPPQPPPGQPRRLLAAPGRVLGTGAARH